MVKRLNVSVSDELHERLQAVKGEINVSQVCQDALANKIGTIETGKSGDLISFLKSGKKEVGMEYRKLGSNLAKDLIKLKRIPYQEFKAIAELQRENAEYTPVNGEFDALKHLLDKELSSSLWEEFKEGIDEDTRRFGSFDHVDDYAAGFIEQVANVWDEVCDKL